ncbi:MAG TPA: Asp-tRNA(Asn)/Glu-tRNA(Gln) amidotransferase subunit GatC [Vicinamibacterales bacterium]|nr:Asp-tRNA(Asn)/Glu-tRNA(Gln) amidotransferase subunit GatC [Vicinamibacterales bacterium]HOQ59224.1 Asp-tRNA(Asn)/Glu-tRNA(Gln) amidotransferase subunit GatC [Vicinamibacterales bacterium]
MLASAMAGARDDFDIARVAALAGLELAPADAARLHAQLASIVGYVGQLQDADTSGGAPGQADQPAADALRPDDVRASLPADAVLMNAPDATADPPLVRVPRVMLR